MSVYSLVPLYYELTEHDPATLPDYLLDAFLTEANSLLRPLEKHRSINSPRFSPPAKGRPSWHDDDDNDGLTEDLWLWYGFSRVNDFLLLPFQAAEIQASAELGRWQGTYRRYYEDLGFSLFGERPYSPFYHEIVEATDVPGLASPQIEQVVWPGLMFGAMLFARAGVRVSFPAGTVDTHTAEESTLYFTFRRRHRRTSDLSLGWGSNSQWRTRFHRSYESGELLYFNVEGYVDLSSEAAFAHYMDTAKADPKGYDGPNAGLSYATRRELLLNRSLVSLASLDDKDLWPYYDTLTAPKDAALWLP